jgi:hypothetical protein
LVEIARTAGKPLFGWVMGKRDEVHKVRLHTRELCVPVFPELYRATAFNPFCKSHPIIIWIAPAAIFNSHLKHF